MDTNIYYGAGRSRNHHVVLPTGLSAGGKLIWIKTGLSVAVCNAIAALAGIGPREAR